MTGKEAIQLCGKSRFLEKEIKEGRLIKVRIDPDCARLACVWGQDCPLAEETKKECEVAYVRPEFASFYEDTHAE